MPEATDVAKTTPVYSDSQLQELDSFDSAIKMLADAGIAVTSVTEYGDGFEVKKKEEFVNVKFVIIDFKLIPADKSDYDQEFAVVRIMTETGKKALLTDGGTGLRAQIQSLAAQGVMGGIVCEKGLVASEYDYVDDNGKKTPAKTFYLSGM